MYPINKYLFETIFENNDEIYQEFMCSIDTEYIDTINILKCANTVPEIRKSVHKLVSIVNNLVNKNYEMVYYCKLCLLIDKLEPSIKYYTEYIKWILAYDKTQMGLIHL